MNTEKQIAHKAARITQNKLYALAAFLYGTGIILVLSFSSKLTDGYPARWLELAIGFSSLLIGEAVARKGEQKK